jgi:hypothetical protein
MVKRIVSAVASVLALAKYTFASHSAAKNVNTTFMRAPRLTFGSARPSPT